MTSRIRLLIALATLVAVTVVLHAVGARTGLSLSEWPSWTVELDDAVIGGLRLLALVLSYYLLFVVLAVLVLGDRVRGSRFERLVPVGMLAALGLVAGVTMLNASGSPDTTAINAQATAPLTLTPGADPLTLDPIMGANTEMPYAPQSQITVDSSDSATQSPDQWTVRSGESFWSIAEESLQDAWGVDDLTDVQVASYWRPLIAANKDRLVDPGNPDLLLPGQELALPEIPAQAAYATPVADQSVGNES